MPNMGSFFMQLQYLIVSKTISIAYKKTIVFVLYLILDSIVNTGTKRADTWKLGHFIFVLRVRCLSTVNTIPDNCCAQTVYKVKVYVSTTIAWNGI